jgi:SOS-response transcriptional repressor LexA
VAIDYKKVLAENVKACMRFHWGKENKTELGKSLAQGGAQRITGGKTNVGVDLIAQCAAVFKLQPWQLLIPRLDPAHPPTLLESSRPSGKEVFEVPRISWVAAGNWDKLTMPYVGEAETWDELDRPVSDQAFSLHVEGDSMAPDFPSSTIIFVDPAIEATPGDYVVAIDEDDHAVFKRWIKDGARSFLVSSSAYFAPKPIVEGTRIVGPVIEAKRRLK